MYKTDYRAASLDTGTRSLLIVVQKSTWYKYDLFITTAYVLQNLWLKLMYKTLTQPLFIQN